MSVGTRFQTLIASIQVAQRELDDYAGHQRTLGRALKAEYAGAKVETIGSHARGSAIGGTSDVDLLVRLPLDAVRAANGRGALMSSSTVLAKVRERLKARYHATDVGKDGQAILVSFGNGTRDIDVVPAAFAGMIDVVALGAKRPVVLIPEGSGGWIKTAPAAHNDYLSRADAAAGGKFKYVAQLLRHWRRSRAMRIPMLTFHAELVLAHQGTCAAVTSYARLLADSFAVLARRGGRALQDPIGVSGWIPIASTERQAANVVAALEYAAKHAAKAVAFEAVGRLPNAYDQWAMVFNGQFPSR
ncbi:MAG: nucleotidyltransferase [Deltaproteobacteria bacterium]|nr:nucleotidyltransferase [Deltaproteobacteria bacterium]